MVRIVVSTETSLTSFTWLVNGSVIHCIFTEIKDLTLCIYAFIIGEYVNMSL